MTGFPTIALAVWIAFFVAMCILDAMRDMRPWRGYYTVHLIKWLAWYPPLAILWYEHIYVPHGLWIAGAIAILCSAVWRLTEKAYKPPHWK